MRREAWGTATREELVLAAVGGRVKRLLIALIYLRNGMVFVAAIPEALP